MEGKKIRVPNSSAISIFYQMGHRNRSSDLVTLNFLQQIINDPDRQILLLAQMHNSHSIK